MSEQQPEGGGRSVVPAGVSKKVGPFPIWVWVVGGSAAIVAVLIIRGTRAPQPTAVGNSATLDPGTGINSTDPLTSEQMLQALNDLSTQLANYQGGKAGAPGPPGPPGLAGTNQSPPGTAGDRNTNQSGLAPSPRGRQSGAIGASPETLGIVGMRAKKYQTLTPLVDRQGGGGISPFRDWLFAIASTHTMGGSSTARLSDGVPMRRSANSPATVVWPRGRDSGAFDRPAPVVPKLPPGINRSGAR